MSSSDPSYYGAEQIEAWARYPEDRDKFQCRLARGTTLIAEDGTVPVAFGQLEPTDHVVLLYCRGTYGRRGIATRIYQELESLASKSGRVCLDTTASRVSRPVFEKQGMQVAEREEAVRHGIVFERFRKAKLLFEPAATRWVILGNSASGKSTLARKIAELTRSSVLDLDTIAWDPSAPQPTRRDAVASHAEIDRFIARNPSWVIEGCHEDLIEYSGQWDPALVFLNPGVETCLARARERNLSLISFPIRRSRTKPSASSKNG